LMTNSLDRQPWSISTVAFHQSPLPRRRCYEIWIYCDSLFWRVKSDLLIFHSGLLVDCRDHISMSCVPAFLTLKPVPLTVRLIQITAGWTTLRGVCRVDLLSFATCDRRLEFDSFLQSPTMPITHSTRYLFAPGSPSDVQLLGHYTTRPSFLERLCDRSIDLIV